MNRKTARSRILDEVHETAQRLRSAGLITKRRMHEYDTLRGLEVPAMGARRIRSIRKHANLSQAVFAAVLNTSVSTVQKWEIGEKTPSGPSLKLLHVIERKGLEAVL
jgi:putative transcriptional regulator